MRECYESRPLISVVMPVFRVKDEYLDKAIESILTQTYRNFEFLIIYEPSDGDQLENCFEKYNDSRIKIIKTEEKYGLSRSLNLGLEKAKGKYIARMDADDISMANRFEKQVDFMENHSEVAVVGTDVRIMRDHSSKRQYLQMTSEIRKIRLLFYNAGISHPTAFVRRSFLVDNDIRYDDRLIGAEDYNLWVDVVLNGGRIECIDEKLYEYRQSDTQATVRYADKMQEWDAISKCRLLSELGEFTEGEKEIIIRWNEVALVAGVEEYIKLLKKIIILNNESLIFDKDSLSKEIAFRFFVKGVIASKHNGDNRMLKVNVMARMGVFRHIRYVSRESVRLKMG